MPEKTRPEIVPAVIPFDFYELEDKVAEIAGHARTIHIDVCDGIFTGNTSWPWSGDKIFQKIIDGEVGFPVWEDVDYEVHLMTAHPEKDIFDWVLAGAYRMVVQLESFFPHHGKDFDERGRARFDAMLEKMKTEHGFNPDNDDDFYQIGLAVTLDTPIEIIKPLVEKFHFIQVMSIPSIGFQGASFDERAYERIKELKKYINELSEKNEGSMEIHKDIAVDGGVNDKNAVQLVESGANRLVVGSFIFKNEIPSVAVDELKVLFD